MHRLVVPPRLDRAEVLNRAYRLIRARCQDSGEDPTRTVVGVIDAGTVPDEALAVEVWRAFRERQVGAVQARVEIVGGGGFGAALHYERGVLADAVNLVRSRWGMARLGVNGAFVRLSDLSRLGLRPWRSEAAEDYTLGVRLRRLGVLIRHDPGVRVVAPAANQPTAVRQYTRAVQGWLQAWPPPVHRQGRDRWAWALHLAAWPVPGLVATWAVAAFAAAAWRLLMALPGPPVDAPRWSALLWTAMGMDTPSWLVLLRAAALWVSVAVAPTVVWWIARRDLAVGRLVRGALSRPLLLVARPVAFGLALIRLLLRLRTSDPVGDSTELTRSTDPATPDRNPVFVDTTGRRRRRLWTVAYGTGVAGLAYVVVLGLALAGGQITPPGGVGNRPHIDYPVPTPTPPVAPQPPPMDEPIVAGNGGVGGSSGTSSARPTTTSPTPSRSSEPPSDEPSGPSPSPSSSPSETESTSPSDLNPPDPGDGGDGAGTP
jgi:Glycosyltransferases, probably involved in cell wall biogenesis